MFFCFSYFAGRLEAFFQQFTRALPRDLLLGTFGTPQDWSNRIADPCYLDWCLDPLHGRMIVIIVRPVTSCCFVELAIFEVLAGGAATNEGKPIYDMKEHAYSLTRTHV